ncbi:MAG: hypothetical protein PHX61_14680, partial [Alphaproteobacteria bacterium]|nr:hypothetical protein [Alphaproteobacteria bacterium]
QILFPNAYSKLRACKNPPCYTLKDNLHEQNISHKMALTDRLLFERMFQAKLNEAESMRLERIPNLAPGDFRTVRQALFYLGEDVSNSDRIAALERESLAKGQNRFSVKSKMGF